MNPTFSEAFLTKLDELNKRFGSVNSYDLQEIFIAGWQACLDFNSKAEIAEKDKWANDEEIRQMELRYQHNIINQHGYLNDY